MLSIIFIVLFFTCYLFAFAGSKEKFTKYRIFVGIMYAVVTASCLENENALMGVFVCYLTMLLSNPSYIKTYNECVINPIREKRNN